MIPAMITGAVLHQGSVPAVLPTMEAPSAMNVLLITTPTRLVLVCSACCAYCWYSVSVQSVLSLTVVTITEAATLQGSANAALHMLRALAMHVLQITIPTPHALVLYFIFYIDSPNRYL